jgi:hypothetical protein
VIQCAVQVTQLYLNFRSLMKDCGMPNFPRTIELKPPSTSIMAGSCICCSQAYYEAKYGNHGAEVGYRGGIRI